MPFRKAVLSLAVLLFSSLALAQGTYTQIDVPGATATMGQGIDTAGDIVGMYELISNSTWNGFLLSGGIYTTINYPGTSNETFLHGLNDFGQIVGATGDPFVGFLYDVQTQTFTTISYPSSLTTTPFAINNAGDIAGDIEYQNGGTGYNVGFELVGSKHVRIDPPGVSKHDFISVSAITASGAIVGNNYNFISGTYSQFLFDGKYHRVTIRNTPDANVYGINPAGTALVGYYYVSSSNSYYGFLYENDEVTILQFPGSEVTIPVGINAGGEVVGYFADASGNSHGFTWTPPAAAGKK